MTNFLIKSRADRQEGPGQDGSRHSQAGKGYLTHSSPVQLGAKFEQLVFLVPAKLLQTIIALSRTGKLQLNE